MADAVPFLDVRALTRAFGVRLALGPVDLEVSRGDRVALTGANGAGKSTLLRCITGTLAPTTGSVSVGGHVAGSRAAKRLIGISLAQERSFYLRLTGAQNLFTFARLRLPMARARRAVDAIVQELELDEIAAKRIDRCSSGMVQQLALARALLGDPQLVLLDEPTRSLDDEASDRLWRAIDARPSCALIIATHRHEDIDRCERRIALGTA